MKTLKKILGNAVYIAINALVDTNVLAAKYHAKGAGRLALQVCTFPYYISENIQTLYKLREINKRNKNGKRF